MSSTEFSKIPTNPEERKAFDRQFMTPKDLAARWKVSESAIHHRKADSDKIRRFRFGRAIRFLRQEVVDFENSKTPLPAQ